MKIILITLGLGTLFSLLVFIFGIWYADAADPLKSKIVLKQRPVVGTVLLIVGAALCLFVLVVSIKINPYHVFFTVGFGMTAVLGAELILGGIFFWRSAIRQREIIRKLLY